MVGWSAHPPALWVVVVVAVLEASIRGAGAQTSLLGGLVDSTASLQVWRNAGMGQWQLTTCRSDCHGGCKCPPGFYLIGIAKNMVGMAPVEVFCGKRLHYGSRCSMSYGIRGKEQGLVFRDIGCWHQPLFGSKGCGYYSGASSLTDGANCECHASSQGDWCQDCDDGSKAGVHTVGELRRDDGS
jgi:hypothetical protein